MQIASVLFMLQKDEGRGGRLNKQEGGFEQSLPSQTLAGSLAAYTGSIVRVEEARKNGIITSSPNKDPLAKNRLNLAAKRNHTV